MSQIQQWLDTCAYAKSFRHELHQFPELTWQETNTANRIREELDTLNIRWHACAKVGTVATLNLNGKGKHIALRADIDALPINEVVDIAWRSKTQGVMHACGHDGHSAVLMGTARWLKANEHQLTGPVTLIFQPAEEGGHGAKAMVEDGALDDVDMIFGWHNWPAFSFGKMLCTNSTIMSGNGTFLIELQGKGGHASQPDQCHDPVLAAAAITLNLQQVVSRKLSPQSSAVLSVTSIDATSTATVIPEQSRLSGSIRFSNPDDQPIIEKEIITIANATAEAYGVDCHVEVKPRYAPTINTPIAAEQARNAWAFTNDESAFVDEKSAPLMASEDFHYYLNEIPGAYAVIGAGDQKNNSPCHSAHYDFNDQLIEPVMRWYCQLAGVPSPNSS